MEKQLCDLKCKACAGDVEPFGPEQISHYLRQLDDAWEVRDNKRLVREFKLKDFAAALELTNRIGELAEQQQHHPDIFLTWGRVKVTLVTHKIGGLHESDFIMAAKIDKLWQKG